MAPSSNREEKQLVQLIAPSGNSKHLEGVGQSVPPVGRLANCKGEKVRGRKADGGINSGVY